MKTLWTTIKVMGGLSMLIVWGLAAVYAWQNELEIFAVGIVALFIYGIGYSARYGYHAGKEVLWAWRVRRMLRESKGIE